MAARDTDAYRIMRRDEVLAGGLTRSGLDAAVGDGSLERVRRGWYVEGEEWRGRWPELRHRAAIAAAAADATGAPVFAYTSAAVLHGLPLYRLAATRVHSIAVNVSRRSTATMVRHREAIAPDDIVEIAGLRCTSLERTVVDLLRHASPEVAVVAGDAALGQIAGTPRAYDVDAAEQWRDHLRARLAEMVGQRGIRSARLLVEMLDGRSELPLESVTKLQLRRLGFAQPAFQVPVVSPSGGRYWMDMEIADAGAFYECDGDAKYTDAGLRDGRSIERVLLDEKQREDWVRGVTGKPVLRGGSVHARTPAALAARLAAFGVTLPDRRARLLLPSRPLLAGQ